VNHTPHAVRQPRLGEYVLLHRDEGHKATRTLFPCPGPLGKGVLVSASACLAQLKSPVPPLVPCLGATHAVGQPDSRSDGARRSQVQRAHGQVRGRSCSEPPLRCFVRWRRRPSALRAHRSSMRPRTTCCATFSPSVRNSSRRAWGCGSCGDTCCSLRLAGADSTPRVLSTPLAARAPRAALATGVASDVANLERLIEAAAGLSASQTLRPASSTLRASTRPALRAAPPSPWIWCACWRPQVCARAVMRLAARTRLTRRPLFHRRSGHQAEPEVQPRPRPDRCAQERHEGPQGASCCWPVHRH
jgi:hypothetical protein